MFKTIGNFIGVSGIESLCKALKMNTTLVKLDLYREHKRYNTNIDKMGIMKKRPIDNRIGDTGAASLNKALKRNTTLTELNLDGYHKTKTFLCHTSNKQSLPNHNRKRYK